MSLGDRAYFGAAPPFPQELPLPPGEDALSSRLDGDEVYPRVVKESRAVVRLQALF